MYEVNANGHRSFSSVDPGKVASVAVTWDRQGHEPELYVTGERADGKVGAKRVGIAATMRETASRLRLAHDDHFALAK